MHFQCFVIYVLHGWYAFDWKAFLVSKYFNNIQQSQIIKAKGSDGCQVTFYHSPSKLMHWQNTSFSCVLRQSIEVDI